MHTYMHARMVALLTYAPPPLHIPLYAECLAMPHLIYIAVSIVASLTFLFGAFLMVSSCLVQGIPLAEHLPRAVMHRIPLAEQQLSLSFPMVVRVALPAICMFAVSFICMFAASFIFLFAVFFPSFYLLLSSWWAEQLCVGDLGTWEGMQQHAALAWYGMQQHAALAWEGMLQHAAPPPPPSPPPREGPPPCPPPARRWGC